MDKILNLKNIAGIEPFSERFAQLDDLYILSHIEMDSAKTNEADTNRTTSHILPGLGIPFRLDGMLYLLMQRGQVEVHLNTQDYLLTDSDIIVVRPGTLMTFTSASQDSHFTLLFISSTFLHSINIDLNSIEFSSILKNPAPGMRLTRSESEVLRKYFDLLDVNASDDKSSGFAPRVASSLISAIVYEILRFSATRAVKENPDEQDEKQNRAYGYVFRFMQLLHINYSRYRKLDFYAKELCITSKYLSMVTKETTGYTASEWINRVVILEAKNIMRFSGKNVQEVAYALNFPSQSAFGKYFKRITGQSPSEFLRHDN